MAALGVTAYGEETAKYRVITGTPEARMLDRVGRRIADASGRDYQWEFKLLDAPEIVNAFCLPGGKIAVYTGILPLTQNEDGLAAVVGHEVAHATSNHGNERMSQNTLAGVTLAGLQAVIAGTTEADSETTAVIMGAVGLGAQYGVLMPYGRDHESEADEIGLRFLVRAGYDPNEAPRLWETHGRGVAQPPAGAPQHPPRSRQSRAAAAGDDSADRRRGDQAALTGRGYSSVRTTRALSLPHRSTAATATARTRNPRRSSNDKRMPGVFSGSTSTSRQRPAQSR